MNKSAWFRVVVVLLAGCHGLQAYVSLRSPWPDGEVRVQLQMSDGPAPATSTAPAWDDLAADAIFTWNQEMGRTQMVAVKNSTAPRGEANGYNNIFFADDIYGEGFGDALAITVSFTAPGQYRWEADILVNTAYTWDSYRGELRDDVWDLRRVLLHEFGHFIGLGHPDEEFQFENAVMNSVITDLEFLQHDDKQGASFNYSIGGHHGGVGDFDDHGGLWETASVINLDESVAGTLSNWDRDYFRISLSNLGALSISTTGEVDTYGVIFHEDGTLLGFDDQSGDGDNFRVLAPHLEPGNYYIEVQGFWGDSTGDYALRTEYFSDPSLGDFGGDTPETARSVELGVPINESLEFGFDIDYFTFEVTEPGVLSLAGSGDFDLLIGILDADFDIVAVGYNIDDTSSVSVATPVLLPGVYYVQVTDYPGDDMGDYELTTSFSVSDGDVSDAARLMNLSVRTNASGDFGKLIVGFVTEGPAKKLLVRGVGGSLADFGVPNAMGDPVITLYDAEGTEIGGNDDWYTESDAIDLSLLADTVGAFELTSYLDSAMSFSSVPGAYTVHVEDIEDEPGEVLVEVYDADGTVSVGRMLNLSTRTEIGQDGGFLTAGFVIGGNGNLRLLIRGIGPQLEAYGVTGALGDPLLEVYNVEGEVIASNDNWGDADGNLSAAFADVGAFGLQAGSADAALLIELQPGAYTVRLRGANDTSGQGLIEVYEVP